MGFGSSFASRSKLGFGKFSEQRNIVLDPERVDLDEVSMNVEQEANCTHLPWHETATKHSEHPFYRANSHHDRWPQPSL